MRKLMAALVLAALAVACEDQATAPEPTAPTAPDNPAFNFMNGPEAPGHVIVRGSGAFWFGGTSAGGVYRSFIGFGNLDPASSAVCGMSDPNIAEWQDHPGGNMYVSLNVWHDATIHVYDGPSWLQTYLACRTAGGTRAECMCQASVGTPRLAQGTGLLMLDFNQLDGQGPGAYTQGWRAHGNLVDQATGQTVRYLETQRYVFNGNADMWTVEKIQLTPTGR